MGREVSFEVHAQGAYGALLAACAREGQAWRGTGTLNKSRVRGSSPALHGDVLSEVAVGGSSGKIQGFYREMHTWCAELGGQVFIVQGNGWHSTDVGQCVSCHFNAFDIWRA